MWHYGLSQWLDIEGPGAPHDIAVIVGGETLTYLTNGAMYVCSRTVSRIRFKPLITLQIGRAARSVVASG